MAELRTVYTPLIQKYGGEQIKIYLETAAVQVKMLAEGGGNSTAQAEIEALRTKISLLESTLAANTTVYVEDTITGRDAIESPKKGDQCWVVDATGDSTVTKGAAIYIWNGTEWKKVSEDESIDVIFEWAAIQGKPSSAVEDIDDAVTKRHEHTNKTVLDKLSDAAGNLTYNGTNVATITDGITDGNILASDGANGIKDSGITTDELTQLKTDSHTHANKETVLDNLSVEGSNLMLNGVRVSAGGYVTVGTDDPGFDAAVAALKLPEGAFITVITE